MKKNLLRSLVSYRVKHSKRNSKSTRTQADDNGAYISKGSATQWFTYNVSGSITAHKSENGTWYQCKC